MSREFFEQRKQIKIRFPFYRRYVIMRRRCVQCLPAVPARLFWERVAPPSSRKMLCPQSLDTPAIQALPPQAEVVKKTA